MHVLNASKNVELVVPLTFLHLNSKLLMKVNHACKEIHLFSNFVKQVVVQELFEEERNFSLQNRFSVESYINKELTL